MIEFEVADNRTKFLDRHKILIEIKGKISQAFKTDWKYNAGAATDSTKTDAPYICKVISKSFFYDCTVSKNGLMQMQFLRKKFFQNLILTNIQGHFYDGNFGEIAAAEVDRQFVVRQSAECNFMEK